MNEIVSVVDEKCGPKMASPVVSSSRSIVTESKVKLFSSSRAID